MTMNQTEIIPVGTYQLIWFLDPKNPKDGLRSRFFVDEIEALAYIEVRLKDNDWALLKCTSFSSIATDDFCNLEVVKLNYSKKNIWKLFKK